MVEMIGDWPRKGPSLTRRGFCAALPPRRNLGPFLSRTGFRVPLKWTKTQISHPYFPTKRRHCLISCAFIGASRPTVQRNSALYASLGTILDVLVLIPWNPFSSFLSLESTADASLSVSQLSPPPLTDFARGTCRVCRDVA
jgi:hypothetical protein